MENFACPKKTALHFERPAWRAPEAPINRELTHPALCRSSPQSTGLGVVLFACAATTHARTESMSVAAQANKLPRPGAREAPATRARVRAACG